MPIWLVAFLFAIVMASLIEYWGHRLMHHWLLKKRHAEHHRDGLAQGWFGEFRDYVLGTCWLLAAGFLHSAEAGWGCLAGGLSFTAWCAYNHQLQHEHPELCFWMPQPVHYIHHHHRMWDANFGMAFDIWDRVFRTYQKVDWRPDKSARCSLAAYFRIKWI